MNVNEFAERIVFGTTLEDKLQVVGELSFDPLPGSLSNGLPKCGPNVDSLVAPGRPVGMQMRHDKGGNARPPADDRLENEQARGQLLHFLANHELLATELMALVLLKFPDAPLAFRKGILATLREEQAHTRMYLNRMRDCGVEFGSFPLSGQFWRVVEPMQSPLDFVSRLSLTFEQANLDYSLHFANVFRRIGDEQSAQLLQQIYLDEIGHVQHGLHWFREWKNPQLSDWQAYQQSLQFPMSPQRGRGPRGAFNRKGRQLAGLSEEFIDAIEVFRQSRGRAPTVRWFDAAAESELAGESPERVAPLMDQLSRDLELVMVAMAKQDDVVLVRRMPSQAIRKHWIDAGFDLPEFVLFEERETLRQRNLHHISPWAWTPKNCEAATTLGPAAHVSPQPWNEQWRDLYRKSWGAQQLSDWLAETQQPIETPDWFLPARCAGVPVGEFDEVADALAELAARGFITAIFKHDLATSGRGQRRLNCREPLNDQDRAWLRSVFAPGQVQLPVSKSLTRDLHTASMQNTADESEFSDGTQVGAGSSRPTGIVEPELDRVVDLSFLWRLAEGADSPQFLGWTRPLVSSGRRYVGTRFGTVFNDCDQDLKRFLLADRGRRLQSVVDWLQPRITRALVARNFSGYFGVDAIVCRDAEHKLKIKPLIELNPRMTMGHVGLKLQKRLAAGAEAEFRIFTRPEWNQVHEQLESIPVVQARDGRWKSGVVRLGEVDDGSRLVPVLLIGIPAIAAGASPKLRGNVR